MKQSDIENGVEICRLIDLLTSDECLSVELFYDNPDSEYAGSDCLINWNGIAGLNDIPAGAYEDEDAEMWTARFVGGTVLECLVKAAIASERLVICGDFIYLVDDFEADMDLDLPF